MISKKVLLLSTLGFVFVGQVYAKTPMNRIDNNSTIAGFDNATWQNGVYTSSEFQRGGGVNNLYGGKIGAITNSDFINNFSRPYGGAIENYFEIGTMSNLKFLENRTQGKGGALSNTIGSSKINLLENSLFQENSSGGEGGAIFNGGTIDLMKNALFLKNNSKKSGGAIGNTSDNGRASINIENSVFKDNISKENAGAIYNNSKIAIKNSSFIDNIAETGVGGAIYNFGAGEVSLVADNGDVVFSGNKDSLGISDYYAELGTINKFQAINGNMYFGGTVSGAEGWSLDLSGDSQGFIQFNNKLENADITLSDVAIEIAAADLVNNSLNMSSGVININSFGVVNANFRNFTMSDGTFNLSGIDVDLLNSHMGKLTADNGLNIVGGIINVGGLQILTDNENKSTDVNFADISWADKVSYSNQSIFSPIYKYDVSYNQTTGNFNFLRRDEVNSSAHATGAGNLANSILTEEIYSRILSDIDNFLVKRNKTAQGMKYNDKAKFWVKSFNTDEDIDIENFKVIDSQFTGILFGYDDDLKRLKNCWDYVKSVYVGYVNGKSSYDGNKILQEGGYLGASLQLYREQFFLGFTGNMGYLTNTTKTSYGKDDYGTILGGVAVKTGVNIPLMKNAFLQPNFYASYSYIKTENYTSRANVNFESDVLSIVEASPGLRVLYHLPYDTDIYFNTRYVKTYEYGGNIHANNFLLPEIGLKSFFEYGVGVQKNWKSQLSKDIDTIAKINRREGGREGWDGLVEVRFAF